MKAVFQDMSKVDFRFPKFHMTLHLVDVIRRFGNLRISDAGPGERMHKVKVKPAFRRTTRRTMHMAEEMVRVIECRSLLSYLTAEYDIVLESKRRRIKNAEIALQESTDVVHGGGRDGNGIVVLTLDVSDITRATEVSKTFPGDDDADRLQIFQFGLVAGVLRICCSSEIGCYENSTKFNTKRHKKLLKYFNSHYDHVRLTTSLRIKAPGQRTGFMFRADPSFRGLPWYSFMYCDVATGDNKTKTYVARALAFVSVRKLDSSEWEDYTLVEWYISAVPGRRSDHDDISSRHARLPLPYIMLHPDPKLRYDLIDSLSIRGGAWVVADFTEPKRFWVLINDAAMEEWEE